MHLKWADTRTLSRDKVQSIEVGGHKVQSISAILINKSAKHKNWVKVEGFQSEISQNFVYD